MNLLPLLAASMCVVDLYDSPRCPGEASSGLGISASARESRFLTDHVGWQLDIMGIILEYMHDRDVDEPGGLVSRLSLVDEVHRCLPYAVTEHDVDNVLNTMSRRINIKSSLLGTSERDNQLIQKRRGGAQFSLRPLGRVVIQLSLSPEDWFTADIEALKIIKSLQHARFSEAFSYCKRIATTLQDKIFDFQAVLEEPLLEAKKKDLQRNEAQHRETLEGIDQSLPKIRSLLADETITTRIDMWIEINPEHEFYIEDMLRLIDLIDKSREILSRTINEIVESVSGQGTSLAQLPNFASAAKTFVLQQRDSTLIDQLLSLNGVATPENHTISAHDFILPIHVKKKTETKPQIVPTAEVVEQLKEIQEAFVEQYGVEFEAALRTGPVSILEIIDDLGMGTDSLKGISALIGVSIDLSSAGFEYPVAVTCDFNSREISRNTFEKAEMVDLILISEQGDEDVV